MAVRLNLPAITAALARQGLNPAGLAAKVSVSREAVSKWLSEESTPKPAKLLELAAVLGLQYPELTLNESRLIPKIAFRKVGGAKTTDEHIKHAQEMGLALRQLVPYLPFKALVAAPTLRSPSLDYDYLQNVAVTLRKEMGLTETDPITVNHLTRRFSDLQAVLIPVLWGRKDRHENATHIYLPDSGTTWIHLNLNVQSHDLLFWMTHEWGHCLTPELEGTAAEDFADRFAGAVLFPGALAKGAYQQISTLTPGSQINNIKDWAQRFSISPLCVYSEMNHYAIHAALAPIKLDSIHAATTNFNKNHPLSSAALFSASKPSPSEYVRAARTVFESPFFDALSAYLRKEAKGPGFVQTVLDMVNIDAKGIHAELI